MRDFTFATRLFELRGGNLPPAANEGDAYDNLMLGHVAVDVGIGGGEVQRLPRLCDGGGAWHKQRKEQQQR